MKKLESFSTMLILLLAISTAAIGQYTGSNPNVALSKLVVATDSVEDYEPAKAVDNTPATYAAIPGAVPAWIMIDLGALYYIDGYGMIIPNGDQLPSEYTFQASPDAATWTDLASGTITTDGTYSYDVDSPDPVRYVRIYMTAKDFYASFAEIFVYGFEVHPPEPPVAKAATNITDSGFTANWNETANADGYVITVALDPGFTHHVPGYENLWVALYQSWDVSDLDPGTTYYYKLRAYNIVGTSVYGNVISATTNKAPQTITFNDLSSYVYGASNFSLSASASSGLPVSFTSSNEDVATIVGSIVTITGAGTASITANQEGNAHYLPASPVARDLIVSKKDLTVENAMAENKVYDGTNDAVLSGATLAGIVGADDVSLSGANAGTFAQNGVGIAIDVITSMTLIGTDAVHYSLIQPTWITADITAKELTVTGASAEDKVYDGTTDAVITGAVLNGVVGSDDVSLTDAETGVFAQSAVGVAIPVNLSMSISGEDIANYSLSGPADLTADIIAKELFATAEDKSREECTPNPEFSVTYSGFVGTEDASDLNSEPVASCSADANSAPGTYDITVAGGSAVNYFFTYIAGNLSVTPDITSPSLTVQNITIQLDTEGNAMITPADLVNEASDNCGLADTTLSQYAFTGDDLGDVSVDVTVTDLTGNETTETAVVTVQGSTGYMDRDGFRVRFYPNPTDGLVTLEMNSIADELKVMNMTGKIIIRKTDLEQEDVIDLSGYHSGMYIIQIRFGDKSMHCRLVKN